MTILITNLSIVAGVLCLVFRVFHSIQEILPAWINPTAGQVQRADECFRVVGSMSVAPGRDPCATEPSYVSSPSDAAFISTTPDAGSTALNASAAADYRGGGWFYCSHHKRLVQLDPTFICPSNGKAGTGIRRCESLHNRLVWGGVLLFLFTSMDLESYSMYCAYVRLHTKSGLCFFLC